MLCREQTMDIHQLYRDGHTIKAIVRLTGLSRNTVRKVLRGEHSVRRQARAEASCLDPYKAHIDQRYHECRLSAVRLMDEITPMGYEGSLTTLRRYLRTLKPAAERLKRLTVRFETPPGKQAQVDWGYCGVFKTLEGKKLSIYVFVMVMSYSRKLYIEFTTSMAMPALLHCHKRAFEYFCGWPETLLYDNMKTVKISSSQWNETFLDFAEHYGFTPKTCRPYRPQTKGKVERMVAYAKDNFLNGRAFYDLNDLNAKAYHWLEHTANVRTHQTTQRVPNEAFAEETLTPLASIRPYHTHDPVQRSVNYESMICFQGSKYSVPPKYAGQKVSVSAKGLQIQVHVGNTVIAEHPQASRAGQCIVDKDHLAELWKVTQQHVTVPKTSPAFTLAMAQQVQTAPLSRFEEVVQ